MQKIKFIKNTLAKHKKVTLINGVTVAAQEEIFSIFEF